MRFLGPDNAADRIKILEFTYIVTIAFLLSATVLTPVFIRHHFLLIKKYLIQEDAVEAVLIGILLLIAYLLSNVYKKELKKYRQQTSRLSRGNSELSGKLLDAFKYIGGVNVQIQEIRSIFCGIRRYPETENEFRKDLALFARKALGIVNADWVVIRIISQNNLRTIKEHLESRKNTNFLIKGISNKAIVANQTVEGFSNVASHHDNSTILVTCVFPNISLDEDEKILIEAITNQVELLYLMFVSRQPPEFIIAANQSREFGRN
jgi:hypothetical protein